MLSIIGAPRFNAAAVRGTEKTIQTQKSINEDGVESVTATSITIAEGDTSPLVVAGPIAGMDDLWKIAENVTSFLMVASVGVATWIYVTYASVLILPTLFTSTTVNRSMDPAESDEEDTLTEEATTDADSIDQEEEEKGYYWSVWDKIFTRKEDTTKEHDFRSEHLGESRQYWRDIILGVNDGLVSTFLLVAGVTGAHLSNTDILLTAIAGTIAGAISMASGEYIATKTQEEVFDGEITVERRHISQYKEKELEELTECFEKIGIVSCGDDDQEEVKDLHRRLVQFYRARDEAHLSAHVALEFGVLQDEKRNPVTAGTVSFFLFFLGALPSVVPFTTTKNTDVAFLFAGILTTGGLLLVGAIKTWATRGSLMAAAAENLIVSAGGGAIAYVTGFLFELSIRDHRLF